MSITEDIKISVSCGQQNPLGMIHQPLGSRLQIGFQNPVVFGFRLPGRPFQSDQRKLRTSAGMNRVARNLFGKRMGGVNHMGNLFFPKKIFQTINSAESADAVITLRKPGFLGRAPERSQNPKSLSTNLQNQFFSKIISFTGSAKDQHGRSWFHDFSGNGACPTRKPSRLMIITSTETGAS